MPLSQIIMASEQDLVFSLQAIVSILYLLLYPFPRCSKPRRLTPRDCANRFLCLWLPVGFSQRRAPVGAQRGEVSNVRVCIPPTPSLLGYCWLHLSTKRTTPVRGPSPHGHFCQRLGSGNLPLLLPLQS